jgi:DNA repair protein RadD
MITLRPYQSDCVQGIRESFIAGCKSPLLVLPTGGGKTIVFTYIAMNTSKKNKVVLILVHRIELINQTSAALTKFGISHGIINAKVTPAYHELVQVASVQTLARRIHKIPIKPDLVVIDEAHHAIAGTWKKIIDFYDTFNLGVTATPIRGDGKGLGFEVGGLFDDMIVGPSMGDLIDLGFLMKSRIVGVPFSENISTDDIKISMGDFNKKESAEKFDKPSITGKAVDYYRKYCPHKPAVAFCINIEHAEHVAQQFKDAGYKAYALSGKTDNYNRDWILEGLENGNVEVVTSCDVISEGTDIPTITAGFLLRPTASEGLYLQQVGRVLRMSEGKDEAFIFDHVGNVKRHGTPEMHRDWSLDGEVMRKRKKNSEKTIPVKQCPSCYSIHEPAPVCPTCGHVYEVKTNSVEEIDGELVEMSDQERLALNSKKKKEVRSAKTLEELQRIAVQRGYKPGWAEHRFKAVQATKQKYANQAN